MQGTLNSTVTELSDVQIQLLELKQLNELQAKEIESLKSQQVEPVCGEINGKEFPHIENSIFVFAVNCCIYKHYANYASEFCSFADIFILKFTNVPF